MKKAFLLLVMGLFGIALFAQNQFEVSFKDLPKDIQKYVTKNYEGFTVDKAMQADSKKGKVEYYDIYVSKGTDKSILTFDKKDNFVKATPVAAVAPVVAPAAVAPAAKPAAAPAAVAPAVKPAVAPVVAPVVAPAVIDTTKKK
jgi:hypothetical protein